MVAWAHVIEFLADLLLAAHIIDQPRLALGDLELVVGRVVVGIARLVVVRGVLAGHLRGEWGYIEGGGAVGEAGGQVPEDEGDDEVREHLGEVLHDQDVELKGGGDSDAVGIAGADDLLVAVEVTEELHRVQHEGHHEGKPYQIQLQQFNPLVLVLPLQQVLRLMRVFRQLRTLVPRTTPDDLLRLVAEDDRHQEQRYFQHNQRDRPRALVLAALDRIGHCQHGDQHDGCHCEQADGEEGAVDEAACGERYWILRRREGLWRKTMQTKPQLRMEQEQTSTMRRAMRMLKTSICVQTTKTTREVTVLTAIGSSSKDSRLSWRRMLRQEQRASSSTIRLTPNITYCLRGGDRTGCRSRTRQCSCRISMSFRRYNSSKNKKLLLMFSSLIWGRRQGSLLLILFRHRKKQQEMSYYQPFYYPYFSARAELPPSLLHLDRKYAELPTAAEAALGEQEARRIELDSFARSHYARAELERMSEERRIEAEVEAQLELKRETDYLHRIAALRRERDLLEMTRHPEGKRLEAEGKERQQATRESYMTDEQLLRHYATGQRFNEYQRDVRDKLSQQPPSTAKQGIAAKLTYSHQTQNSPAKAEKKRTGEQNRQAERNLNGKSHREEGSGQERDRAAQAFKRSYIDELNDSKGQSMEKGNYLRPKGETIELLPQSQLGTPFLQHRYGPASKNNKKKRGNQSVSHVPKKKQKEASLLAANCNRAFTAVTASEAMKKINNRLKVSAIVYKDSKLRNQRHEIDHLFNTFQVELKGRKEVKERINSNPDVLRKHNMVVGG